MKVEFLESVKHAIDDELKSFSEGDIVTVPDAVGQYFCGLGWAKDVDGKVETGERDINRVVLTPANVLQSPKAQEIE